MSRLTAVDPKNAAPAVKPMFDSFIAERGAVPNMFRTLAHAPDLLKTFFDHFRAALAEGEVPVRIKEMVAVRVSHLNCSSYCLGSHTGLAKRFGVSDAQIESLQGRGNAEFTPAEKAAVDFAEGLTKGDVTESMFAALRKNWSERAIVEIACVACVFNYTNKFNCALATDLTVYPKKLG